MKLLSALASKTRDHFRWFMAWFMDLAACRDSVFRFIWMVLTFGYAYPRRRVGENFMYCVVRHVVIFFSRLFCIFGAVYYIYRWFTYATSGAGRELNTLKRETKAYKNETLVPYFTILYSEPNKLNVTSLNYITTSNPDRNVTQSTLKQALEFGWERTAVFINANLSNTMQEYVEVVVEHQSTLPTYPWFKLNLFAPPKIDWKKKAEDEKKGIVEDKEEEFTDEDKFNEYYYQPGYYVEIRYTPIEVHKPPLNSSDRLTLIKNFVGFGEDIVTYSYESSVSYKPFPASVAAAKGYTNNTSVIILRPQAALEFIYYHEEKTTFRDTMSSIGGLLSLAGSVIAFLFGAGLMSPWGKLIEVPYFRRKVAGSLAKAYGSDDGISKGPFTGRMEDIGKFDPEMASNEIRIALLKERMDELELVLTEYFIDGDIFHDYASQRQQLKDKQEALVRAASTRNDVHRGDGPAGQYIPLLPSQKLDQSRRQSISGHHNGSDINPMGHKHRSSDPAYPYQRQPLSPPLPLPQSRSSYYGTRQGGGRRHRQSSSEQSLLHHSDMYSPNRASDETVNNNDNRQSMDNHGQPMYQAPPMSPTDRLPSQQQEQYQQHSRYSSSSWSPSPSSLSPLAPAPIRPSKDELMPFSVIHEVSGEVQPPSTETAHATVVGEAGTVAWQRPTIETTSRGDNTSRQRLPQQAPHQRYSGQDEFSMDMSDMSREP